MQLPPLLSSSYPSSQAQRNIPGRFWQVPKTQMFWKVHSSMSAKQGQLGTGCGRVRARTGFSCPAVTNPPQDGSGAVGDNLLGELGHSTLSHSLPSPLFSWFSILQESRLSPASLRAEDPLQPVAEAAPQEPGTSR